MCITRGIRTVYGEREKLLGGGVAPDNVLEGGWILFLFFLFFNN